MEEEKVFYKLLDIEKDMLNLKEKFMCSFADRLMRLENAIESLDTRTAIFVPDKERYCKDGVEAYFGKVNSRLAKQSKDITMIKATLMKVNKA